MSDDTKIYIAASSKEIPLIQGFIKAVREYGYEVTFDWTLSPGWNDPNPSHEFLTSAAQTDLDAVRAADILWYVAPAESSGRSEGSATELGAALALGKIVITSGDLERHRIFPRLAGHRFALHAEALEFLRTRGWDTDEAEVLRMLAGSDSVEIPTSHLGLQRAARALEAEGKTHVTFNGPRFVVRRAR